VEVGLNFHATAFDRRDEAERFSSRILEETRPLLPLLNVTRRSVATRRAASGLRAPACRTRPAAIGRVFLLCESRQPPFPRPRILLIARVVAAAAQGRLDVSICAAETRRKI
jgi:hypothetical protein